MDTPGEVKPLPFIGLERKKNKFTVKMDNKL